MSTVNRIAVSNTEPHKFKASTRLPWTIERGQTPMTDGNGPCTPRNRDKQPFNNEQVGIGGRHDADDVQLLLTGLNKCACSSVSPGVLSTAHIGGAARATDRPLARAHPPTNQTSCHVPRGGKRLVRFELVG